MKLGEIYRDALVLLGKLQREDPERVFVIAPEVWPPAGLITRNRAKIVRTLEMGYGAVVRNRAAIERFLGL
jgi:hypothetical protein